MFNTLPYTKYTVRAAAVLTNSYVAGSVVGPGQTANPQGENPSGMNQLVVYVAWTKSSATSLEIKVEFSHDGVTYYQQTATSVSSATITATPANYTTTTDGNHRLEIPIKDNYIKISAKCTGTVTSTSCAIDAICGVV